MSSLLEVALGPVGRDEVLARYVEFVAARCRPNTVLATVSDLRVFFAVIDKDPVVVTPADVFEFITVQRRGAGDGRVVRLADGGSGMNRPGSDGDSGYWFPTPAGVGRWAA